MAATILNIVAWLLSGTIGFYLITNFIKVFKDEQKAEEEQSDGRE